VELPPGAAAGMTIDAQVAQPQPAAIATARMGTEVPGGIDSAGAAMGRGHRLGWRRRGCLGRRCLVLTQGTMGLMPQPHKGLEFFGVLAA
jgi:hypothetical protein